MNNVFIIILSVIMLWFCVNQIFKITKTTNVYLYSIIYVILLYLVLFNREKFDESIYSDGTYIIKWIKLIFTNKIVFINLIGNILIFVPLGIFLKYFKIQLISAFMIIIILVISIESLQYLTKRGIFDIIDIFLNIIGAIIGYILIRNRGEKNE
ncbi:MAG: VanZ family protein [Staphylococcus sp.]|jgi:lin1455 protein|nr:VanZ family protein [Staphylococcus sp.]